MAKVRRIAVALQKGGVGKSTTAVNLAAGLAAKGARVLLVDTDSQGQASLMLGLRPGQGLAELVTDGLPLEDVLTPARDNLWLLAGGRGLAGVGMLISQKEYGGEKTLSEALSPADGRFDYVIVDTAPGWGPLVINVLFYVQEVLTPVSLEVLTLAGLLEFQTSLEAIHQHHKKLRLKYVLPTFMDGRVKKSTEILEQLQGHFPKQLCPPIRYNVRLSEAPGHGQTIYEYAPRSSGAADYEQLTERIAHGQEKNS